MSVDRTYQPHDQPSTAGRGGRVGRAKVVLVVAALMLGVVVLAGLAFWATGGYVGTLLPSLVNTLSLSQLGSNPERYYGQTVDVRASVETTLSSRALVITERALPENYLVLVVLEANQAMPTGLRDGDWVVVRGTVRRFDPSLWGSEVGVAGAALEAWAGRPAIVGGQVLPIAPAIPVAG